MRVFNVHRGQDTGGWGHRLSEAFATDPEVEFSSMYAPNAFLYIAYPPGLAWDRDEGQKLWKAADVVHLHNGFRAARIFETRGTRPIVVQYHGTAFRSNPTSMLRDQLRRGAIGIVSTLDLYLMAPAITEWIPSPYDLEWLRGIRH